MIHSQKTRLLASFTTLGAISVSAAFAATTPYDLIRPTWPLSWDSKVFEQFDASITKKTGMLPKEATPASFKAGEMMPDTLDQAYFDAINTKISPIRVNQAGYLKSDKERQFYFIGSNATEFEIVDAYGKTLNTKITGTLTATEVETKSDWTIVAGTDVTSTDNKRYQVEITGPSGKIFVGKIPQSVPTDTRLRIKIGDEISSTFIVSDDVYTMAKDATLKFFGIQRSGDSESWFHGPSHVKDGAGKVVLDEKAIDGYTSKEGALQGGWYDCGDHLKESQTQAFAFMALAVMSATNPSKDVDHYAYNQGEFVKTDGVPDVLREAKHGADFFLRSYEFAKGVIDDMPVSVGNFGHDHGWWGRPEAQDYINIAGRGGPDDRDVRLGELGANISGEIAAGLAILAKDYTKYDKKFADSCLMVAEKMYDFAKSLAQGKSTYDGGKKFANNKRPTFSSPAYNGNNEFYDDLALASVALLYATGKKDYADDMIRTKDISDKSLNTGAGFFEGGWFANANHGAFLKDMKNTNWANSHSYALYALYKLILANKTKATTEYGLTEEERLNAIEDCLADMIANLGDMGKNDGGSVTLPAGSIGWKQNTVSYDPTWYTMFTDGNWNFNRYQMGNVFEVLAYSDVAADIEKQGITLPKMALTDLKVSEMKQLGINQLNYTLGVNPWDISFVYGIGDKNDAHPHHRASNPEGRNTPGFNYKYNCPVGALLGGVNPSLTNSWVPSNSMNMSWEDYIISETCLDASTVLLSALTIVSNGGDDYYEKKCDNCKSSEASPFSGEIYATAYHYTIKDVDYFNIQFFNESLENADNVVAYVYYDATEEDAKACGATFFIDMCQTYDIAGFGKVCDKDVFSTMNNLSEPKKVDDTYNKDKKTYTWEQAISIGTLGYGNQIKLDIGVSAGTATDGKCSYTTEPTKVKVTDGWSFTAHSETKDAPAYEGAPDWRKDQNIQQAPKDPYIVIRSNNQLLWGFGPAKTTEDRVDIVKVANGGKTRMQLNGKSLFVSATAQGTKTVKIFDLLGNQLMEQTFDGFQTEVGLSKLPHRGTLIAKVLLSNKQLAIRTFKLK